MIINNRLLIIFLFHSLNIFSKPVEINLNFNNSNYKFIFDDNESDSKNFYLYDQNNKLISHLKCCLLYPERCYIEDLKTVPEYRKKGFGSLILSTTISYFQYLDINTISLEAHPYEASNKDDKTRTEEFNKLITFYEKHGFVKIGNAKNLSQKMRYSSTLKAKL